MVAFQCTSLPPCILGRSDKSQASPHISLVHGPPGTGKTSTIAALVIQIFSRWRHLRGPGHPLPRVLIVAPSNAAVDEICLRIKGTGTPLNLMRIGVDKAVHPGMRQFTFENLRDSQVAEVLRTRSNAASLEQDAENTQQRINQLGEKIKEGNEDQMQFLTRKIKEETERLRKVRSQQERARKELTDGRGGAEQLRREMGEKLFAGADVVAATLSSSMNGQMEGYFCRPSNAVRPNFRPFSICVADEASQCIEPEALVPLRLGFSKLVMVGDPEQLPATVSSLEGRRSSLADSLFKRLCKEVGEGRGDIVHKLDVQYRMHEEIARWPNK